ncbi:MAG: hypothetical protein MHM6MM_001259 [Cercozoa sp. M6MM]
MAFRRALVSSRMLLRSRRLMSSEARLIQLNREVSEHFAASRFAEAAASAAQAIDVAREEYGEDHFAFASAVNNLAVVVKRAGDLEKAQPLMRFALQIYEKVHGPEHLSTASVRANLAVLLRQLWHERCLPVQSELESETAEASHGIIGYELLDEARELLTQALKTREKAAGEQGAPDHPLVASTRGLLASVLGRLSRRDEAEAAFTYARQQFERHLREDEASAEFGTLLHNFGVFRRGECEEGAEQLLRDALTMRARAVGEEHADFEETANALLRLLRETGQSEKLAKLEQQLPRRWEEPGTLRQTGRIPTTDVDASVE